MKNRGVFIQWNRYRQKKKKSTTGEQQDEKQNSYALRNQTKKLHSSDFIYIWFKTGKTSIFVTDVRIAFILGDCNYWETLTEIPPMLVLFYV